MKIKLCLFAGFLTLCNLQAVPVTFEALPLGNPGTDGSTEYGTTGTYYWNGSDESGPFNTQGVQFDNSFTDFGSYTAWNGFAYSNTTDNTTSGFGNQYSAAAGSGADGSAQYAIAYLTPTVSLSFDSPFDFSGGKGVKLTNTTYAALDMQDGSSFSKKFGGATGTDADWFMLSITGSIGGSTTGTVDFYLADFRSANSAEDYILTDWTFADLSSLGNIDKLEFNLSSSDSGAYGMNTPSYFAMDDLGVIPEPSTMISLLFGAVTLFHFLRKGRA